MMKELDPTLPALAQAGNENAMAAVIARMMPVIRQGAALSVGPGLDFDDAVQEGLIGLFRAVKAYRAGSGARFETYATACIKHAQRSAQRAAGRKKHGPLNNSVPLREDTPAPGPEELLAADEAYADALVRLNTRLSTLEKRVIAFHLEGKTALQTAAALGISPKAVENAMGRARRKLKSG